MKKTVRILGIRGIPAAHGGFETFAERLALYLVARGWRVVVYCQEDGAGEVFEDIWRGVERVRIPIERAGPRGTMEFDWRAIRLASMHRDLCLTLGYNTAIFCAIFRLKGIKNLINMDGIEWARAKWGIVAKVWFWMNEWMGCWVGTHLIADHPEIKSHLSTRVRSEKISTIAYGSDIVVGAPVAKILSLDLLPGRFLTLIARAEPENSVLEVVRSFSSRRRGISLVVLGAYDESNGYHRQVLAAAGPDVKFLGAIYDKELLHALRFHSLAYIHGHQVGGTNPSLVEAMGAGNAIIAHDNKFNRWVAGEAGRYFSSEAELSLIFDDFLQDLVSISHLGSISRIRHTEFFTWDNILNEYEFLLEGFHPNPDRF